MHTIYVITNKINGKQYVGQTNNFKVRWAYHRGIYKSAKTPLAAAMRKYGAENFSIRKFMTGVPHLVVDHEERKLIYVLDTYRNGYNATLGGRGTRGCKCTPERIQKISKSKIGKKRSPETIAKMRAANLGKKMSPESSRKKRMAMLEVCKRKKNHPELLLG